MLRSIKDLRKVGRYNHAFTLVEVILASAILTIIVVGVSSAFIMAANNIARSANIISASNKATGYLASNTGSDVDEGYVSKKTEDIVYDTSNPLFSQTITGDANMEDLVGIYETTIIYNGARIKYYYYRPYHPYSCGMNCEKCNPREDLYQ